MNKDKVLLGLAVLGIIITGLLLFNQSSFAGMLPRLKPVGMTANQVAQKSIDYINANLLSGGRVASIDSVSQESGIIKLGVKVTSGAQSDTVTSYVTTDGRLFFPEAFEITGGSSQQAATQTPAPLVKADKAMLQAYVVSDCPFGLQVQRALVAAVKAIPALAEHIKVLYLGSVSNGVIVSMHGVEEAKENLRQICIREEQPVKYWNYVGCYMQKLAGNMPNGMPYGDTKSCQTTAGIDTAKLNACVTDPAKGLAYAQQDFSIAAKFNDTPACKANPNSCPVAGSPTLILNNVVTSESGFGGRTAEAMKKMVCDGSKTAPSFCSTTLDTTPAATSFSLTYASASAAPASTNAANCAPATN